MVFLTTGEYKKENRVKLQIGTRKYLVSGIKKTGPREFKKIDLEARVYTPMTT